MALYNSRGNLSVSTDSGWGMFTADGKLRVTIVSGTTRTGLYAANGGYNVVITQATDSNTGLYHPCGALRVVESTSNTGVYAPNGAFFVSGAAYSAYLLGSDTDGLALASRDDTMTIRSTSDTNDNYQGTPGAKLTTTRASTASYWDVNGVLQYAATGTLRRDFDPRLSSTVERCGYLIEEARTNTLLYSSTYDNAAWNTVSNVTLTAAASTGPDGLASAYRILNDTVSGAHRINQGSLTFTAASWTYYTIAKAETGSWLQLAVSDGTTNFYANFNLSTGVVGNKHGSTTSSMWALGNGWYLCAMTQTTASASGRTVNLAILEADTASYNPSYVGTGVSLLLYGSQVELGPFASSYIPTTSATVTRAADLVTLAGTLFPLNQAEGTLYAKAMHMGLSTTSERILQLDDGTASERILLNRNVSRIAEYVVTDGGVSQVSLSSSPTTLTDLTAYKAAAAYKLNDSAVAQAGQTVQTDIVCTMPTTTQLVFGNIAAGNSALSGWLFEAAYFPSRKTNSQLQALASGYASDALLLAGTETQYLTFSATDQSMSILDTGTPANNYSGDLASKLGTVRASNAYYYNSAGLLALNSSGTLRLDYDSRLTGGPGYLVEEARTNLVLQSQTLGTTWAATRASVSADATAAPDGTTTADKLVEDGTAANNHNLSQGYANFTSGTTYALSIYAKKAERERFLFQLPNSAFPANAEATFNLNTGVVASTGAGASSASIQALANGWYRCTVIAVCDATTSGSYVVYLDDGSSASYNGDGTSGAYFWGAQLEAGAFATSYIPTTTATVTRAADDTPFFTAIPISTDYTLVAAYNKLINTQDSIVLHADAGSGANYGALYSHGGSSQSRMIVQSASVNQVNLSGGSLSAVPSLNKTAAAFRTDDFAISQNGAAAATDALGNLPAITGIRFGKYITSVTYLNGWLRHGRYFPRRVSNSELATLAAAA